MTTFKEPKTIGEFNERLRAMDIDACLTPESLKTLYANTALEDKPGRDRILRALRLAEDQTLQGSLRAKDFIQANIKIAIEACAEASPPAQPAPRHEEPQAAAPASNNVTHIDRNARHSAREPNQDQFADASYNPDDVGNDPAMGRSSPTSMGAAPRLQVKAFGKRAALCVESDVTRRDVPTVRFELAECVGEKKYDWKNKVIIQLTQDEIIEAAAALLGFVKIVEFKNHGDDGKFLSLERQGPTTLVRGGSASKANSIRLLPINAGRTTALTALLLGQLDKSLFGAGGYGVLLPLLHRVTAEMMNAPPYQRTARGSN